MATFGEGGQQAEPAWGPGQPKAEGSGLAGDKTVIAYARWVIRRRWPILLFTLLAALLLASGASRLKVSVDYRYFFAEDNPQLQAYEKSQAIYSRNDNILFVLAPEDKEVFSSHLLAAVEQLTEEAWKIPLSTRVDSITNFQHTWSQQDDLTVEDLVTGAADLSPEEIAKIRRIALNEPLLRDRLLPLSAHVTAVNVNLELQGKDAAEQVPSVIHARKLASQIEEAFPGVKVRLTGMVMLNNAFLEASMRDMQTLVPLMYLIIILVTLFALRSISGTLATVIIILFSAATAMGVTGWLGIPITPPSSTAPTIIMMLAVADSIHILVSMLHHMRKGLGKHDALVESLRLNMKPVFLTSLTTCIGFLGLNFSKVPPLNDLGNIATLGVVAAFVYSVLLLPALMAILPVRVKVAVKENSPRLNKLADFVIRRRHGVLWGSAAVALLVVSFIPLNELKEEFVKYFDETTAFRTDTDFTIENLSGIYQIEYSLGTDESYGISDPGYLQKVDAFAEWFRRRPRVNHVFTFTDVMKRLNMNMHGDDPSWYRLPESRQLAAQYLLLYEMSLPYGLDLNNQINVDKSSTRVIVTIDDGDIDRVQALVEGGEQWLRDNGSPSLFSYGVGTVVMFAYITGQNVRSMLIGTAVAFLLVSFALIFALRSTKFGLLSLVPNLVPVLMGFGLWGLFVGRVNFGLTVVAAISLGIVVDDTVHFLSKYLRARREMGLSAEDAVRYAFSSVGTALIVTTVVLVSGFLVLTLSPFDMNAGMGKLTATTVLLALIADFLLLPTLLLKLDGTAEVPSLEAESSIGSSRLPAPAEE